MAISLDYVRRQLAFAKAAQTPSARADALSRLEDGLEQLEYQLSALESSCDEMLTDTELDELLAEAPMDPMPTIEFDLGDPVG